MSTYPGGGALGNFFNSVVIEQHGPGDYVMSIGQHVAGIDYTVGFAYQKIDPALRGSRVMHAMRDAELQLMMEALWSAGVRPKVLVPKQMAGSEGFNAGKVEAMQEHLRDLRRMVFSDSRETYGEPQCPDTPLTKSDSTI